MLQIETPGILKCYLVFFEHVMMNIKNIGCVYHPRRLISKFHVFKTLQWGPTKFFPKITENDLRRFSLQFSLDVIVAIHEKLKKFQNISIEDLSENLQYLEKRFQRDSAVYRNKCRNNEAFSRYASCH